MGMRVAKGEACCQLGYTKLHMQCGVTFYIAAS